MSREWFYTKDGKSKVGPVSSPELQALAKSGQLLPTDMVWKQGMSQWRAASAIKGLFVTVEFTPKPPSAPVPANAPPADVKPGDVQPAVATSVLAKAKTLWQRLGTPAKIGVFAGGALLGLFLLVCAGIALMWIASSSSGGGYFPPLRDGDLREYSLEYSAPLGGVQKGRIAYRIDGRETINGQRYFKEVTVISGIPGVPAQVRYVRMDKQGIHVIDGDDNTKTEYTEIPFPVKVGNSWTVKKPKGDSHYRAEGIEALQLFDRKYEGCLKVSFKEENGDGYSYYAPGVGEVKGVARVHGVTIEIVLDKR